MNTRHLGLGLLALASLSLAPAVSQIHCRPFIEGYPATIVSTNPSATYNIAQNSTMKLSVNGGAPITITFDQHFGTAVPGDDAAAEIYNDVYAMGVLVNVYHSASDQIVIQSLHLGLQSSLKITDGVGSPAQSIGLPEALATGTQTVATKATKFNDLILNEWDYVEGDKIVVFVLKPDGSSFIESFNYGNDPLNDGTTLGDLIDYLNTRALFNSASPNGATVSLSAGQMYVSSNGLAGSLAFAITDDVSGWQAGWTHWPSFIRAH